MRMRLPEGGAGSLPFTHRGDRRVLMASTTFGIWLTLPLPPTDLMRRFVRMGAPPPAAPPARSSLDTVSNRCRRRADRVRRRDNRCLPDGAPTFVHPWFTSIVWRPDGSRVSRAIPLLPDMMGTDEFRRLRVLLRYGRREVTAGAPASHA
jgi:hypothetical protein